MYSTLQLEQIIMSMNNQMIFYLNHEKNVMNALFARYLDNAAH